MATEAEARNNNFKSYEGHIRFWEKRENQPPASEEEIKAAYERSGGATAIRLKRVRQGPIEERIPPGLPLLIKAQGKEARPVIKILPIRVQSPPGHGQASEHKRPGSGQPDCGATGTVHLPQ